MPKKPIILILASAVVLTAVILVFMKRTAAIAHDKSRAILDEFKTVDENLKQSTYRTDSLNRILKDSSDK